MLFRGQALRTPSAPVKIRRIFCEANQDYLLIQTAGYTWAAAHERGIGHVLSIAGFCSFSSPVWYARVRMKRWYSGVCPKYSDCMRRVSKLGQSVTISVGVVGGGRPQESGRTCHVRCVGPAGFVGCPCRIRCRARVSSSVGVTESGICHRDDVALLACRFEGRSEGKTTSWTLVGSARPVRRFPRWVWA